MCVESLAVLALVSFVRAKRNDDSSDDSTDEDSKKFEESLFDLVLQKVTQAHLKKQSSTLTGDSANVADPKKNSS